MANTFVAPAAPPAPVSDPPARSGVVAPAPRTRAWPLLLLVLVGGAGSLVPEMAASRLLAPAFGSSQYIWAIVIGLVMIFLAVGDVVAGRLADRVPRPALLYGLVAAAGVWMAAIPLIGGPVLAWAKHFPTAATSVEYGSFFAVLALFTGPFILVSCITPFAIRLRVAGIGSAGATAGSLYALSTLGSIAGTFGAVFLLLPYLGITLTLVLAGAALLGVALLAWLCTPHARAPVGVAAVLPSPQRGGVGGEVNGRGGEVAAIGTAHLPSPQRGGVGGEVNGAGGEVDAVSVLPIVVVGGIATLGLEFTAAQLLRPYFGSSQFIWANLIGLVLVYLTIGYFLGGRLADRSPNPGRLFRIVAGAGIATALIPILARPLLGGALEGFAQISAPIFLGSLVGVIALFAVPMILLACVSPFAIRLQMREVRTAGATAGTISALSTLGSIGGIFIPVFVLLPTIGSARTLYLGAGLLLLAATFALFVGRLSGARLAAVGLLGVAALSLLPPPALIKPPPYGHLLAERESVYNYIQVVQLDNGDVHLVLNEGHAVHSIYRADPTQPLTNGPWDYWLVAPYVNANMRPADVHNLLMLGSAAGTAAQLFTRVYGPKPVDDVEIDPEIVGLAQQYFHLNQPNINNIIQDARVYLRTTAKKYTVVGIDAYRQPYIPFHLTTHEFFMEARDHLEPNGVVMINAGRTGTDFRLVDVIAATMRSVFPHVYIIDVASMGNSMVIGSMQANGVANFQANLAGVSDPMLRTVFDASIARGHMREVPPAAESGQMVFTDDRAPVEEVVDQVILNYVTGK